MSAVRDERRGAWHRDRGVRQLDQGGPGDVVAVGESAAVVDRGSDTLPGVGPEHGTVWVVEPTAVPVPGVGAAVPVIARVAAGTRARTRSAKISAPWKADAAEGPYRRAYSCVNCAASPSVRAECPPRSAGSSGTSSLCMSCS